MPDQEPLVHLVARSSLGGHAWCAECRHPDLTHWRSPGDYPGRDGAPCYGTPAPDYCECPGLRRMTAEEFMEWRCKEPCHA